jgi:DNA recombination protein RmuC
MSGTELLVGGFVGLLVGISITVLSLRPRLHAFTERLAEKDRSLAEARRAELELQARIEALAADLARATTRLESEQEKVSELVRLEERIKATFGAVAADALKNSSESFLQLATQSFEKLQQGAQGELAKREEAVAQLVKPVAATLERVDRKIEEVERLRSEAHGGLMKELTGLKDASKGLQSETSNLVSALRTPVVRGQWGEIQLRRVVEMAGMEGHYDFVEQASFDTADGRIRPDLIVLLPGGRRIAVDAKVPLEHFLKLVDARTEDERQTHLTQHVRLVRDHVRTLNTRLYFEHIGDTPDFTVMFMSDAVYSAAVQHDPTLVEFAIERQVLLATPMLLIGLLRTVAHSWRQEQLAESAAEISELGKELYKRLATLGEHFAGIQKGLERAVSSYNKAAGSLETRVFAAARKFADMGIRPGRELDAVPMVGTLPREASAPEFSQALRAADAGEPPEQD